MVHLPIAFILLLILVCYVVNLLPIAWNWGRFVIWSSAAIIFFLFLRLNVLKF
jgi:hypothetical protein